MEMIKPGETNALIESDGLNPLFVSLLSSSSFKTKLILLFIALHLYYMYTRFFDYL